MAQTLIPTVEKRSGVRALVVAALGFFVLTLDTQIVTVAMPVIGHELHGGINALQWVATGYTLMLAALLLSAGSMSDRLGASRTVEIGLIAFTLASAAGGLAPGLGVLIGARFVQGAAAAAILPASLSLVRQAFPDTAARTRAIASWTAAGGAAMAAGPLVGGLLTSTLGWRWVFFVNVPIGIVGLVLLARMPRSLPRRVPFDLPGQISVVVAVAAVTYAVIQGGRAGLVALAVFVAAAVCFFVVSQSRSAHPMVPPQLFRSAAVTVTTATGMALNFGFYGVVFLMALYFEQLRGLSSLVTGLMFLPMTALITVVNLLAGRLTGRYGPRLPMLVGQALLFAGMLGLLALDVGSSFWLQVVVLLPFGLGGGLAVPALTAALMGSVDADRAGMASGVLNAGRQFGGALGVAVFGTLAAGDFIAGLHLFLLCWGLSCW
ncbi:MFS transporter [Fodinicola feengrottensis]|uniref:MFS transporter n=1 Tax=Fodinicola feengrottensis TaxID=435914 RepID=UPI0013CFB1BE|nr:MFS transporter [Fodinicola feengrottensis]